jgi:hypothetical protein
MEFEQLENQLRDEGAPLPPALRDRVLHRCAEERRKRQAWHRRFDCRLASAVAGLCLFYWLAMGVLDAQRAALMFPSDTGSDVVLIADNYDPSPAALEQVIKARSRVLATLLNDGRYGREVDYDSHNERGESG